MGPDQIGVKISSKLRVGFSGVVRGRAHTGRKELKNDAFPFDGADMLQETDVDILAFRNAPRENEFLLGVESVWRTASTPHSKQTSPIKWIIHGTNPSTMRLDI